MKENFQPSFWEYDHAQSHLLPTSVWVNGIIFKDKNNLNCADNIKKAYDLLKDTNYILDRTIQISVS